MRRTHYRLAEIEARLEFLAGYLIAHQPRRGDPDHPRGGRAKAGPDEALQADRRSGGSDLNMRLRALRRLEEIEIRTEEKNLKTELKGPSRHCSPQRTSSGRRSEEVTALREKFGPKTPLGKRRTRFSGRGAGARRHGDRTDEAMVEREPITVVVSAEGLDARAKGPRQSDLRRASPSKPTTGLASRSLPRPRQSSCCLPPTGGRHARCQQDARRAWSRRTDPPVHRS